jgi:hypothetical protein
MEFERRCSRLLKLASPTRPASGSSQVAAVKTVSACTGRHDYYFITKAEHLSEQVSLVFMDNL